MQSIKANKETIVFYITIGSAALNIILNFVLIPFMGEAAAALTTLLSEGLSYVLCMLFGRKIVKLERILETILKSLGGSLIIIGIFYLFNFFINDRILFTILVVAVSFVLYFAIEFLLRNDAVTSIWLSIKNRFPFKRKKISNGLED